MKCFRGGRRTSAWQAVTQLSHTSIRKPGCKWFAWILHPLGTRAAWEINHTRISTTPVLKHWTWKAVEFSCSVFCIYLCTNAGLPMRIKESCLCTMKILFQTKLNYFYLGFWRLFFQALQVVLFCWVLVFCFVLLFFLSKHTLLCTLYPRQEQEGYSHGMTEILTQTRSARNLKRNISKIWSPSLPFQNACMPWISL